MVQIEISRNSSLKLENNQLDRILKIPMVENYGFIRGSKIQEDGDLADCYVVTHHVLNAGLTISLDRLVLLGVFQYLDKGELDNKYVFGLKQEAQDNLIFYAYRLGCIEHYLKYYKTISNEVKTLILSNEFWKDHLDLLTPLKTNLQLKDLTYLSPDYLLQ